MTKALQEFAKGCKITIADKNEELRIKNYESQVGEDYLNDLDRFDVLIKSPGIPMNSKLQEVRAKLTTPTQIFFDSIQDSGAIVVGVTGSKGKSTTSSLIHQILRAQSSKLKAHSYLVGNIGDPAIAHLSDAKPGATFVCELSSYQLMDLTVSPHIAVVTSFFPDHLDYHGSLEAYKEAKKHIARFQKEGNVVFFAGNSEGAREIAMEGKGKKVPFIPKDAPVALSETKLIGEHNLSNIAGAFLVSQELKIPKEAAMEAIRTFTPLPHRLQSVGVRHGIEWIDDSISTTPESAIAALDALGERVAVILLGGTDRGYDFTLLAERLKISKVTTAILFPDTGSRIKEAIEESGAKIRCFEVKNMEEAVGIARQEARNKKQEAKKPIVLLSPASPSYNMYKNFEERGNAFVKYMNQ